MKEAEIQEKVKAGYLRARVIFEMIGNPKEHVVETLKTYTTNIKSDERLIVIGEEFGDPEQMEDPTLWSTFCEMELLARDLEVFTWLSINFTPASIEIIEPEEFLVTNKDLGIWLNELLLRLHEMGTGYKQQSAENQFLKYNINALIRNGVILALEHSKTKQEIASAMGIADPEFMNPFLEAMITEKRIEQDDGHYKKYGSE